jgi:PAN domain
MNLNTLYYFPSATLCYFLLYKIMMLHVFLSTEAEIIPGPPLRPECNVELHTDYTGAAVRWGLTHHKESAADCCQACLDQAKRAKPGEIKCNIWVYCPSEFGCYSPDIYEHKHQECWLKMVIISFSCFLSVIGLTNFPRA